MELQTKRFTTQGVYFSDLHFYGPRARLNIKKGEEVVLLLHGYQESGLKMLARFKERAHAKRHRNTWFLAPNGPLLVPYRKANAEYRMGYAWYFYDFNSDDYIVDMKLSVRFLGELLMKALAKKPTCMSIVGYSQGGYLAPFVAEKIANVKKVVGVNCRFLEAEMAGRRNFELFGLNGAQDTVVDPRASRKSHLVLQKRGYASHFELLKNVTHLWNEEVPQVSQKVLEILSLT